MYVCIYSNVKIVFVINNVNHRCKEILAKTKTNQTLSTNLATTHHVGVITISEKLHNGNILFYISNSIFRIKH